jgi:hypothetical protein
VETCRAQVRSERHPQRVAVVGADDEGKLHFVESIFRVLQCPFTSSSDEFGERRDSLTGQLIHYTSSGSPFTFSDVPASTFRSEHPMEKLSIVFKGVPSNIYTAEIDGSTRVDSKYKIDQAILIVDASKLDTLNKYWLSGDHVVPTLKSLEAFRQRCDETGLSPIAVITMLETPNLPVTEIAIRIYLENLGFVSNCIFAFRRGVSYSAEFAVLALLRTIQLRRSTIDPGKLQDLRQQSSQTQPQSTVSRNNGS